MARDAAIFPVNDKIQIVVAGEDGAYRIYRRETADEIIDDGVFSDLREAENAAKVIAADLIWALD